MILMHMQGTPRTMQRKPTYQNVVREVREFLAERIQWATDNGIDPGQIVIDPGIGFGKTLRHNLLLLNGLSELASLGRPVLVGASRKAFIGKILQTTADDRLEGSLAVAVAAVFRGANVIRAHDVKENKARCGHCGRDPLCGRRDCRRWVRLSASSGGRTAWTSELSLSWSTSSCR